MKCGAGNGRVMDVDVDTCGLDCCACNTEKEKYSPAVTCQELPGGSRRLYGLRCRLLSSVSLAVVATTMAAFDAGLSPALAQCVGTPDNVTCSPGGNPYATGINVNTANAPINLTLQSGVNVTIPAGSPGVNAVNAANTTGPTATSAPVTITADGVTINNNNNPTGNNQTGLRIQSSGDATITATNSTINLSGTASDFALYAIVLDGGAPHNASVNLTQGTVATFSGNEAGAIQADNRGNGFVNRDFTPTQPALISPHRPQRSAWNGTKPAKVQPQVNFTTYIAPQRLRGRRRVCRRRCCRQRAGSRHWRRS